MTDHTTQKSPLIPPHIFWPGLVVALLTISFTAAGFTIYYATTDASFSVDSSYYDTPDRAASRQEQQTINAALAWQPIYTISRTPTNITLEITDAHDRPLQGASISLTFFHHATSSQHHTLALTPDPATPGTYTASPDPLPPAGNWQLTTTITRGPDTFIDRRTFTVE